MFTAPLTQLGNNTPFVLYFISRLPLFSLQQPELTHYMFSGYGLKLSIPIYDIVEMFTTPQSKTQPGKKPTVLSSSDEKRSI